MKIIQLKCPSCGAPLKVSDSLKSFTCNFCGETTLLDDEIIRVEHTIKNADTEEVFKKIDGFIKLGYTKEADDAIKDLIDKRAYDPKTWLYAIKVCTNNYDDKSPFDTEEVLEYLDNYKKLEEDDFELKKNIKLINDYLKKYKEKLEEEFRTRDMVCPYCGEKITFGQKSCNSCGEELFWQDL